MQCHNRPTSTARQLLRSPSSPLLLLLPRFYAHRSSPKPSLAPINAVGDSELAGFLDWAKATAKIEFKHLQPKIFSGAGRGLATTEAVKLDEVIVSVPRDSAITLTPRQKNPFPAFVKSGQEYWDTTPWYVALALMLIHQNQEKGFLYPYIQELPKQVPIPIFWVEEKLEYLQYPWLMNKVAAQKEDWARLYSALQKGLQPGKAVSQDEFYWALSCVRSRTFSGPYVGSSLRDRVRLLCLVGALVLTNASLELADELTTASAAVAAFLFNILYEIILSKSAKQYAMCPVVDFLNHSSTVTNEVSYDYFADCYTVAAGQDYKAGEQLLVTYGQNNDGLMQYYGFAEVDNANADDTYVMSRMLEWVGQVSEPAQSRIDEAAKDGILELLKEANISRTGLPPQSLQCLRFLLASDADKAKGLAAFASSGSDALESRMAEVLVHACIAELNALGTSFDDDATLLDSSPSDAELAVACVYRMEKKKILIACLRNLGMDQASLKAIGASGIFIPKIKAGDKATDAKGKGFGVKKLSAVKK